MRRTGRDTRAVANGLIVFFAGILVSGILYMLLAKPWDMIQDTASGRSGTISTAARRADYTAGVGYIDTLFGNFLAVAIFILFFTLIVYAVYSREVPGA